MPTTREYATGLALAAALTATLGATAACGSAPCRSPRTISVPYRGDSDPTVTADQKTWRLGILAVTAQPQADIIFGFEAPKSSDHWHDSTPVPSGAASSVALKIGPGAVMFSAQYEAPAGSTICQTPPVTTFGPEQSLGTIPASAASPSWP